MAAKSLWLREERQLSCIAVDCPRSMLNEWSADELLGRGDRVRRRFQSNENYLHLNNITQRVPEKESGFRCSSKSAGKG